MLKFESPWGAGTGEPEPMWQGGVPHGSPDDGTLNGFMKYEDLELAQGYHGSSPPNLLYAYMCVDSHTEPWVGSWDFGPHCQSENVWRTAGVSCLPCRKHLQAAAGRSKQHAAGEAKNRNKPEKALSRAPTRAPSRGRGGARGVERAAQRSARQAAPTRPRGPTDPRG